MASKSVLRVAQAASRFVLRHSKELDAKIGTLAIAAGVAGVACLQGLDGPDGVEFATQTLKGAGIMLGASASAHFFGKMFKNSIKTLDNWANNEPLSILINAGEKGKNHPEKGEKYLKQRLENMEPREREIFHGFTAKLQRLSEHTDVRFSEHRLEIASGLKTYRNMSMGLSPGRKPSPENKPSRHRVGDVYSPG